jgi:phosphonate metabolism protein PhnN/1,5-bisphosphokinase (PRPP-forming)
LLIHWGICRKRVRTVGLRENSDLRSSGAARRGTLVLVVGPSGAGKDSIIRAAAVRLSREPAFVFAPRLITRPADSGGEAHIPLSRNEFAAARDAGRLMLHWEAHGFAYGLADECTTALASGLCVVANVSRTVIAEARRRLAPVAVVAITAPRPILAGRLAARGRESAAAIEQRLQRGAALPLDQADFVITNDGPVDRAVERFVTILRECSVGRFMEPRIQGSVTHRARRDRALV